MPDPRTRRSARCPRPAWWPARLLLVALLVALGCVSPPQQAAQRAGVRRAAGALAALPPLVTGVGTRNLQHCAQSFEPGRDYFPDRFEPHWARGFSVRYEGNVKWLAVRPQAGGPELRYALVQCGTPPPENLGGALVIPVPVASLITLSTTELAAVDLLGLVDRLLAHGTFAYVSSPAVRARIQAGAMFEAGAGAGLDIERIIAAHTGLLLADTYGDPELDAGGRLATLEAAGVPVVAVPSYRETAPLGRAEWLGFVSLFANREARARAIFARVEKRYQALAARGRAAEPKPLAITGAPVGDTWHVPGGRSFMATLLADAGFAYPWSDDRHTGSLALAFEAVWQRALRADWWLHPSGWRSRREIVAADARLAALPALAAGKVAVNDARLGSGGGNDYWESGTLRPDLVLADLLALAHPDLLPAHHLVYHRRLAQAAAP